MTKTFYFDTGVKPYNFSPPVKLVEGQILKGTVQIPFDCDNVPANAKFEFACDSPTPINNHGNYFIAEMKNTTMVSKFAHFRLFI